MKDHELLDLVQSEGIQAYERFLANTHVVSAHWAGPCKIGWAINSTKRLPAYQLGNPEKLHVRYTLESYWARSVEREAKLFLKNQLIRGEWFDVPVPEAIEAVKRAAVLCNDPEIRAEKLSDRRRRWYHFRLSLADKLAEPVQKSGQRVRREPLCRTRSNAT